MSNDIFQRIGGADSVRWMAGCALLAGLLTLSGCSGGDVEIKDDSIVTKNLYEFAKRGPRDAVLRLEKATSFEWDRVFYFYDGKDKQEINDTVDYPLFNVTLSWSSHIWNPLLVFQFQGKVVHAVKIIPPLSVYNSLKRKYALRDTAVLVAYSKGAPYALKLQELPIGDERLGRPAGESQR